ncbi:membrane-associated proteins in eicosanoid and glutathione metabolism [Amylocystis lapponica]|nr:membrane-associated proteins in eicosanoid and glutathione metabolism [Amylocystis lapponica]
MSSAFVVPREMSYPAAAILSTLWLATWQTMRVGFARSAAGIKYPQVYGEKAEAEASKAVRIFNCTQRAHQNTLEQMPAVLAATTLIALNYPVAAAALCGFWTFARVLYTIGYSTGEPDRRNFMRAAQMNEGAFIGFLVGSSWSVAKLLL